MRVPIYERNNIVGYKYTREDEGEQMKTNIVHETKPIKQIEFDICGGFTVGINGITRIEPMWENGQMATVPWFLVYSDEELVCRVNGAYVQIVRYK